MLYSRFLVVSIPPSCSIVHFWLVVLIFVVFRKGLVVVSESGGEATCSWLTCHTRHTHATGTGFSGVWKCQPAPARDLNPCGFANLWHSLRIAFRSSKIDSVMGWSSKMFVDRSLWRNWWAVTSESSKVFKGSVTQAQKGLGFGTQC